MVMTELSNKRILLGVTGGIAAYKSAELLRELQRQGADVQVIMTESACRFVTPVTMQALSGKPVFTDMWDSRVPNGMPHIELSRDRDLIVVAPATAGFIAKLVHGAANDLLSTLCLARECPLMVAPAMNRQMWENPATQRNIAQLHQDGIVVLGPDSGEQACGETGMGRMLEPVDLARLIGAWFQPKLLAGTHVLITAGPTFEPIDPVRGITNRSSGKMGYAVARAALEAGAQVTLIWGPVSLEAPRGVRRLDVTTAREMQDAVMAHAGSADVFVAVAAVADWRAEQPSPAKLKKSTPAEAVTLRFVPNPDILAAVAALPSPPFCVGFAAESERLAEQARAKLAAKRLPLIVANRAEDAIGADDSELILVDERSSVTLPRADKLEQARRIVAEIAARLPAFNR